MSAPIGKLVEPYSGFDPRTIPGCVAWYDAADSNTVTLSGTNLSKWFDKSSNSNALIPNGDASRTGYSNVINGFRTVSVNGTGGTASLSNSNAFTLSQPNTSFAVIRTRTTGFAGTFNLLYSQDTALFQYRNQAGSNLSMWAGTADVSQGNNIRFTSNATRTHVAIFNSNSSFVGANGSMFSTGATPGTNGWINLQVLPTGAVITQAGDCGEVIMYNSSLSSNDRQIVEGYLNWKWGIQTDLPATHPYRGYVRPFTRPFRPLDISGCALWLDAADRSTILTNGNTSNVVQWNDKSPLLNNITRVGTPVLTTSSNFGIGGVLFNGTDSYFSNTTLGVNLTNYSVFFVCQQTSYVTNNLGILVLTNGTNLDYNSFNTFVYSSGQVSPGAYFWWGNGAGSYQPTPYSLTPFSVYGDVTSGTSKSMYRNGNLLQTQTFNSLTSSVGFVVGGRKELGTDTISRFFSGLIGEVLIFNTALTSSQRQQVEGYLADKWGLRGNAPSTHAFKSLLPLYPSFTPLQISNCVMWLDAAEPSTITLSGSNVTAWTDKSGSANSCSQATASNQPTYLSNDRSVNFNGSNFLLSTYTALLSNGTTSIFAAFTPTAVGTRENTMIGANGGVGNLAVVTNQQSTHGNFGVNGVARGFGSFTVRTTFSNLPSVGLVTISSNVTTSYANGGSAAANVTIVFVNAATVLGGYFSSGSFYTVDSYIGKIHEVLFYNRIVTTAERYQIEGYLANKWKVGLVQTTAVPTDYSNCALWLDAADVSSIDLSGSNVTVWRDKSGNNYNASNTANKGPTYSGGVLNFNGTSNSLSVPVINMPSSNHCLIAVHRPTTITGNNQGNTNVFRWQAPFYLAFPYMNGTTPRGYVSSTATAAIDAVTSTLVERSVTTGYNVITANIASGSQLIYRNGVLMSSATEIMKPNQTMSNFAIGSTVDTLSEFYQGSIAEVIVFSRQLTSNERSAIENRLISKWNALGLPSQHPYKNSIA